MTNVSKTPTRTLANLHKNVDKGFRWKTKDDEFLDPRQMTSKHLFYAWLMIYNHSAPEEHQIWFTQRYVFTAFYTPKYMFKAFEQLYYELKTRKDLGPKMLAVIAEIESIFLDRLYDEEALEGIKLEEYQ